MDLMTEVMKTILAIKLLILMPEQGDRTTNSGILFRGGRRIQYLVSSSELNASSADTRSTRHWMDCA